MICHNDISINDQSFVFDAKIKAFNDNIPIDFSAKDICPAYNLAGKEIGGFLVFYLIAVSQCVAFVSFKQTR